MHKLSVVSYLNTAPFLYGIAESGFLDNSDFELSLDIPATCALKVKTGKADIGLIPVAVLPDLNNYHLIGNTCIGADGPVDSVLLLSQVPLQEIKTIYLDYQSRTSNNLCRILASMHWKINVTFINSGDGYINDISNDNAGIVIGDRALDIRTRFRYVYDLSESWKEFTGLPFVFAVWTSLKPPEADFSTRLELALQWGIDHAAKAAELVKDKYPAHFNVESYLTRSISYTFDEHKRKGLETFLSLLSTLPDPEIT